VKPIRRRRGRRWQAIAAANGSEPPDLRHALLHAALVAALLCFAAITVVALELPRGALRTVVRACALTHRTIGVALPCLAVDPGDGSRPGYAILRAPDRTTHVIVVPLDAIDGIEDRRLLQPSAGAYWRAALAARSYVVDAAKVPVALSQVALAINSERTRSQDQLHIHAECVRPEIATALLRQRRPSGEGWTRSQQPVAGSFPNLRTVKAEQITAGNVFEILASVPGGRADTAGVMALLVQDPAQTGRFVLAAQRGAGRSVETLFAHSCKRTSD
jgi:CDP-diacylglycerol pyrophosphatase